MIGVLLHMNMIEITGATPLDDEWFTIHLEFNGRKASYDTKNDPLGPEDDERIAKGVHRAHVKLGIIDSKHTCYMCR